MAGGILVPQSAVQPAPPHWKGRVLANEAGESQPHLGKCEIHKAALEIQKEVGFSGATVSRGLSCIGVDVEVFLR